MTEVGTVAVADSRRVDVEGVVTVGAETGARLGVPVGTKVSLGLLASTDPSAEQGEAHPQAHLLRGAK